MDKKWFMGIFIIFVMVFSVFGFVLSYSSPGGSNVMQYNDFEFTAKNKQVFTEVDGVERGFLFFPGDLQYIQLPDEAKVLLDEPAFTVTYDPKSELAEVFGDAQYYLEVQLNDKAIERALTNNEETSLKKASCEDATENQPVIELRKAKVSEIKVDGNCIIIKADDAFTAYRQVERIIYTVLGVME